jgi:hypothetical protein
LSRPQNDISQTRSNLHSVKIWWSEKPGKLQKLKIEGICFLLNCTLPCTNPLSPCNNSKTILSCHWKNLKLFKYIYLPLHHVFHCLTKETQVTFNKYKTFSVLIYSFSIFAQVNITNPTRWLVKFDVISCYIHLQMKFTGKEIREIKINSVSKNTKACVKILKQLFASGSVIIGEYSPRLLPRLHYTGLHRSVAIFILDSDRCCLHYATVIRYARRRKNHSALEVIWKVIRYVPKQGLLWGGKSP